MLLPGWTETIVTNGLNTSKPVITTQGWIAAIYILGLMILIVLFFFLLFIFVRSIIIFLEWIEKKLKARRKRIASEKITLNKSLLDKRHHNDTYYRIHY